MGTLLKFIEKIWQQNTTEPKEQPGLIERVKHIWNTGSDPGEYGEWLTEYAINALNSDEPFFVLKNIYIPYKGRTTEIDLILLHKKGIYVFESKNYSGWIFGNKNQTYWTQTIRTKNGVRKTQFYNPIMQNNSHIKALKEYIGIPEHLQPTSIIVFGQRCELKAIPENDEKCIICQRSSLLTELKKHAEKSKLNISERRLQEYNRILSKLTNASDTTKKNHIEQIERYK